MKIVLRMPHTTKDKSRATVARRYTMKNWAPFPLAVFIPSMAIKMIAAPPIRRIAMLPHRSEEPSIIEATVAVPMITSAEMVAATMPITIVFIVFLSISPPELLSCFYPHRLAPSTAAH